jgi:hypothetical protein
MRNYVEFCSNFCYVNIVNWPYGKYGLPKPKSGCPENTWLQGWRRQYLKLHSRLSFDSQMDAQGSGSYVNRTFCMKNNSGVILKDWPKGKISCPTCGSDGQCYIQKFSCAETYRT